MKKKKNEKVRRKWRSKEKRKKKINFGSEGQGEE